MSEQYKLFTELSKIEQAIVAGIISAYSHPKIQQHDKASENSLAEVNVEEILASELAIVCFAEGLFAGYIRAKPPIVKEKTFRQVGSLVVMNHFRRQGIAGNLVGEVTSLIVEEGQTPFAFSGPASQPTFTRAGYFYALPGELPEDAVSERGNPGMIYPEL